MAAKHPDQWPAEITKQPFTGAKRYCNSSWMLLTSAAGVSLLLLACWARLALAVDPARPAALVAGTGDGGSGGGRPACPVSYKRMTLEEVRHAWVEGRSGHCSKARGVQGPVALSGSGTSPGSCTQARSRTQ